MIGLVILAGHLLGDWVVQTDYQANMKVRPSFVAAQQQRNSRANVRWQRHLNWLSWTANQMHMATYHLTLAVLVVPFWWSWRLAVLVGVSWVTHSFIDRRWPVIWLLRHTGSAAFSTQTWGVLCADQALHLTVLAVTAAVLR